MAEIEVPLHLLSEAGDVAFVRPDVWEVAIVFRPLIKGLLWENVNSSSAMLLALPYLDVNHFHGFRFAFLESGDSRDLFQPHHAIASMRIGSRGMRRFHLLIHREIEEAVALAIHEQASAPKDARPPL